MTYTTSDTAPSIQQTVISEMTTELVAAYVSKNSVPAAELPGLIRTIHDTLAGLDKPAPAEAVPEQKRQPAVPIRKSVTDDYIISLEDGRKFKSMKRYLAGLGMTPADYRAKWGLPADYPMVAPAYAAKRSELARSSGLGRKATGALPARQADSEIEPELPIAAEAPKRGRARKAA